MLKKVKSIIINFINDYYKMIIFLIIFCIVVNYPVPYYVFTSGGITDLSKKFFMQRQNTRERLENSESYISLIQ